MTSLFQATAGSGTRKAMTFHARSSVESFCLTILVVVSIILQADSQNTTACDKITNYLCRYSPQYVEPTTPPSKLRERTNLALAINDEFITFREHITLPTEFARPLRLSNFSFYDLMRPICHPHDENKKFADPFLCKRYSLCQNGHLQLYLCPLKMVYSETEQQCVHEVGHVCADNALILGLANWRKTMSSYYEKDASDKLQRILKKEVTPAERMFDD